MDSPWNWDHMQLSEFPSVVKWNGVLVKWNVMICVTYELFEKYRGIIKMMESNAFGKISMW